jgi:polysaccharide pyruvyl transferase WcaK-like protein
MTYSNESRRNPMRVYEILGIGFPNRGAELLLLATIDALRRRGEPLSFLCQPTWQDDSSPGRILSLGGKLRFGPSVKGIDLWRLAELAPAKMRSAYGWGRESEVSMALDASGLAYSEKNGASIMRMRSKIFKRYKKRGVPIILLPQALGPFETPEVRQAATELFSLADLIFPRDSHSQLQVANLGCQVEEAVPDITIDFKCGTHDESAQNQIGIVPNFRMVDKGGLTESSYLDFLSAMAKRIHEHGVKVVWINHEGEMDLQLIRKAQTLCGGIGEIFDPREAISIKNKIGNCSAVFSSRYHGLVSSLSQAIPCVGTSWSHKYQQLSNDFGDGVKIFKGAGSVEGSAAADWLLAAGTSSTLKSEIQGKAAGLQAKIQQMWAKVESMSRSG